MSRVHLMAALLLASLAGGEDWPQWRGPERTGVASVDAPDAWPAELTRRWRVEVGLGHASPVVRGGIAFALTREGESERLRAIELATGK